MILAEQIRPLVEEVIAETDFFIVEISVQPGNKIFIYIDGNQGVKVGECVEISRHVESALNRDIEDFELLVSSAGLDRPLKVQRQYVKNTGQKVEVLKKDGVKLQGIIQSVTDEGFNLQKAPDTKIKKGKSKQITPEITEIESQFINFEQVKTTKLIVDLSKLK